jgi:hypothetical protein
VKGFKELLLEKDSGSALVLAYVAIFAFVHYLKIDPMTVASEILTAITWITVAYIVKELGVSIVKHIWRGNGEPED